MKKFTFIFLVFFLFLFLVSKVLEIDPVGYFEREVIRVQYVNSQQQLNSFNETFDPEEQTFTLFDENCNCLLYTSPSPRDMRRSRMPSSA